MAKARPEDVERAVRQIEKACAEAFHINAIYLKAKFELVERLARAHTMKATGELESKLSIAIADFGHERFFSVGYDPTTNNQSYSQEFDINQKVHTSKEEHLTANGYPKCSRKPHDLFKNVGGYTSNPQAERRALGNAIETAFGTSVNVVHGSNSIRYEPNMQQIANELSGITNMSIRRSFL